jgi:hypothetical protein
LSRRNNYEKGVGVTNTAEDQFLLVYK